MSRNLAAWFLLCLILSACVRVPASRTNQIQEGFQTEYFNPTLGLSGIFPGDFAFKTTVARLRKTTPWVHPDFRPLLKRRLVVTTFATEVEPYYSGYLLQLPAGWVAIEERPSWLQPLLATGPEAYEGIDSSRHTLYRVHAFADFTLLWMVHANIPSGFDNLLREFQGDIFPELIWNLDSIPQSRIPPLRLAEEAYADESRYLDAWLALESVASEYPATSPRLTQYWQNYLTYSAHISGVPGYDSVRALYAQRVPQRVQGPLVGWEEGGLHDLEAWKALVTEATQHQVVMFNESHVDPHHRSLLTQLLPAFHEAGFQTLALEGLGVHDAKEINKRGFAIQSSGYYTREPEMAHLIRVASRLGMRLVAYERTGEGNREEVQARNLIDETLRRFPKGKVLVLAGYGHIHEGSETGRELMMAGHFQRLTGIDPFTIDQTDLQKFNPMVMEAGHWLTMLPEPKLPNTPYLLDTDVWLVNTRNWTLPEPLPLLELEIPASPVITQLFVPEEWEAVRTEAIPRAQYWGIPKAVHVEPGRYWIRVMAENGEVLAEQYWETP
ncbi:MAG TPA: hypothetical protein DCE41_26720 [Cytophagales bacterium]|nr:hypothetical protein [Cytophagales bacterium]